MGWFDNLKSKIQSFVSPSTAQAIASTANKALAILTSPIQSITNWQEAQRATEAKSATRLVIEGVSNVLPIVAFSPTVRNTVLAGAGMALTQAGTWATENPIKAIAVAGAGVVTTNALIASPTLRGEVLQAPSSLANLGKNIGEFAEQPSIANAIDIVKENPVLAGTIATGLAIGVGTATNSLSTFLNTRAINKASEQKNNVPLQIEVKQNKILEPSPFPEGKGAKPKAKAKPKKRGAKKKKRKVIKRRKSSRKKRKKRN